MRMHSTIIFGLSAEIPIFGVIKENKKNIIIIWLNGTTNGTVTIV